MVEEDPKNLFGDVDNFFAPDAVRTRNVDGFDEREGLGVR